MNKYFLIGVWFLLGVACSDKNDSGQEPAPVLPEEPGENTQQNDPTGLVLLWEGFDKGLPPSFKVYDEDKRVQAVEPENTTWTVAGGFAKSRAVHDPAGAPDNWLSTGGVKIDQGNTFLSWRMIAAGVDQRVEQYEVYVSTTGQAVKDFQGLTPVFRNDALKTEESPEVDLKAFVGKTVYVAFRHMSAAGNYIRLDYVKILHKFATNLAVTKVDASKYNEAGTVSVPVKAIVANYGFNTVTKFKVVCVSDGAKSEILQEGISLKPLDSCEVVLPDQVRLTAGESNDIKVFVLAESDEFTGDDTLKMQLTCFNPVVKRILAEKITQVTCSNCGANLYVLDQAEEAHPDNFVGVSVYYSDPLSKSSVESERKEYEKWVESWGLGIGLPASSVNRKYQPEGVNFVANFQKHYDRMVAPADVAVRHSFSADSSMLTATVSAKFAANMNPDMRLGGIVLENGITAFGQVNAPAGKPIVHNHVARALLGTVRGAENSVPKSVHMDETCSYEFKYTIPAGYKKQNLNVVGLLLDGQTGEVLNAAVARKAQK